MSLDVKDMALEVLKQMPKFAKLNPRQREKAVKLFTNKILSADVNSPLSQKAAKVFLKQMFRVARAVK